MQKFSEFVNQYKDYKMKESGTKKITKGELKLLRESYESVNSNKVKSEKLDEYKAEVKKFREWKEAHGKGTEVSPVEMKKIREMVEKRGEGKNTNETKLEEKKEGQNTTTFKAFVNQYREWKQTQKGTSRLTEKEKENLQRMFFNESKEEKKTEEKVDSRLEEALNGYKNWKKTSRGTDSLTESEKAVIARSLKIEDINTKLNEAKNFVKSARTKLQEGDAMDGAVDVQSAGNALTDANALATDALATDTTPLPENITNGILEVKNSIDALAASAGIASPVENPVSMDADPNAGVPAVMDTNLDATASDPNAVDANAVPMAESKEPNAEGKEKLTEAKSDPAEKDLVTQPSTADLLNGYPKTGEIKHGLQWPNKEVKEPKKNGLGNIEESQEQQDAKAVINEEGNFSWANFLKLKRERA